MEFDREQISKALADRRILGFRSRGLAVPNALTCTDYVVHVHVQSTSSSVRGCLMDKVIIVSSSWSDVDCLSCPNFHVFLSPLSGESVIISPGCFGYDIISSQYKSSHGRNV